MFIMASHSPVPRVDEEDGQNDGYVKQGHAWARHKPEFWPDTKGVGKDYIFCLPK